MNENRASRHVITAAIFFRPCFFCVCVFFFKETHRFWVDLFIK